ncbi:uncharacterized protein J4E78_000160 [Alternaria triticimaculans]|uniref:uncharacterized protein n=1 Tax=Alternaria triticimaculans TaxID=297637 RepID=UPI0020C2B7CF|nr:uncharacterized protein J4E78_000160 [Alternaria triticimaculans]KAI4671664.1 hypothetical protein J4E78_000160 [Alternaria triticimaculans]
MSRTNVMEPPIVDLARLNVNDARENNAITDIVQTSTMNAEPADWKIMAWQACQQGRSVDVKSILRNLEPQDVSHFVNARGEDDNTALIIVAAVAHKDVACATIIPVLLEAGADINAKNKKGRTALMEAALWGGLAAVKALLKWKRGVPVNASLEDNFGLSAIELAGTDSKLATERKNRCAHGKNVQTLLDGKLRIRIVKLLKPVDNGKNVPRSTRHVDMQKRIEDGKDRFDADILKETQAKLKAAEDLAKRHLADLEKTRRELRKKEGELVREHSKLMNAQTDMNDVYAKFRPPSRSNVDRAGQKPQFRKRRMSINPSWFRFDFTMTFDVEPVWKDATMAYMKINEKHFFAKNGKAHDTQDGYISGEDYSAKAFHLQKRFTGTVIGW